MGINKQSLKALLFENDHKRIYGKVLLIGRSTVCINYPSIQNLFKKFSLSPPNNNLKTKITKHQIDEYGVNDVELFHCLSNEIEKIDVLDISKYEGAEVICDLNYPVSSELIGKYDFIYDSSVLDNLFNPAEAIKNFSKILKPKGRYFGINVSSYYPGAMVSCHPEWFYSFFAINNFYDAKVYVTEHKSPGLNRFEYNTNLFRYQPSFTLNSNYNHFEAATNTNGIYHSIVIAEKDTKPSLDFAFPINLQYVTSSKCNSWENAEERFMITDRPIISRFDTRIFDQIDASVAGETISLPHLTDHYVHIGGNF